MAIVGKSGGFAWLAVILGAILLGDARSAYAVNPPVDLRYYFTDLGTLGGAWSLAFDINEAGQVTGQSRTSAGRIGAFRTAPNSPIVPSNDLGSLGGSPPDSYGDGINNSGQVVGSAWGSSGFHSYFTLANAPISPANDMGTLGGWNSYGTAINDKGQIVGAASVVSDTPYHAFRTSSSRTINAAIDDLGTLGGTNSNAEDINESGQVVGSSDVAGNLGRHAYRTAPGGNITPASDLGTLGGRDSYARGVNEAGQAVGFAYLPGDGVYHAFRTGPNAPIVPIADDLLTLGGLNSEAADINDAGIVVGWSEFAVGGNDVHAFVHVYGQMLDLNTLIASSTPLPTGWTLAYATAINNKNQIVVYAIDAGGNNRAFLLTPVPEPGAAAVALLVLAFVRRPTRG